MNKVQTKKPQAVSSVTGHQLVTSSSGLEHWTGDLLLLISLSKPFLSIPLSKNRVFLETAYMHVLYNVEHGKFFKNEVRISSLDVDYFLDDWLDSTHLNKYGIIMW